MRALRSVPLRLWNECGASLLKKLGGQELDESGYHRAPEAPQRGALSIMPEPESPRQEPQSQPSTSGPLDPESLKLALKAFNKRLRLTRLDDESKLGYGAMTGGGKSGIVAISPPNQYPKADWDELVRQGKLKYVGRGIYEPMK